MAPSKKSPLAANSKLSLQSRASKPKVKASLPTPAVVEPVISPSFDPASDPAASSEPSQAHELLARLRPRWPTLSSAEIAAFDTLSTDARRSELGGRTKARGVAADALRWAGSIDRQLRDYEVLREHYTPKRFSYYLHCLAALVREIDQVGRRRGAQGAASGGAHEASAVARAARSKLIRAMDRFAGRRDVEQGLLSAARGTTTTDVLLVSSIQALVALSVTWLKAGSPILLDAAHLTPTLLDEVRAAASALASAGASETEIGFAPARDTPMLNLVEGGVLEEMLRVYEDVHAAREESPLIERLLPSVATRAIFGLRASKKAAPADPAAEP